MTMNEKIAALRKERGLTLEEVGDYVGVGKSTVRKWEAGIIENMRRDKILRLAEVLGVTPGYLMGWEEETSPDTKYSYGDDFKYGHGGDFLSVNQKKLVDYARAVPEDKAPLALRVLHSILEDDQ